MFKKVSILGGGEMGRGIAILFASKGIETFIMEKGLEEKLRAQEKINSDALSFCRNKSEKIREILQHIKIESNLNQITSSDLVIEAIYEDYNKKIELFDKIITLVDDNIIIATNTSTLNIDTLASVIKNKKRFLGLHFFNPAYSMKLVEVVRGKATSEVTIDKAVDFCEYLGKKPIVVNNVPGFIVNRILFAMINEAFNLLESGAARAEDIDNCMKYGANHLMGPLALADLIGLDICCNILTNIYKALDDDKYCPSKLIKELVNQGRLGRKTGEGIYKY